MKTIFWNVDTQYDFMRPDGALYVPGAETIEGNLEKLTRYAHVKNLLVVNTADWHTPMSQELSATPDYKTTFPPHCLIDTRGADFVPATCPEDAFAVDWRDARLEEKTIGALADRTWDAGLILYKDAFDIFAGNPYANRIVDIIEPERAIVYGVATNVCVHYAVTGLLTRGIDVIVVRDAIKELPNLPLQEMLDSWTKKGVRFAITQDIMFGKDMR
ncbi:cysteine hydrolase [Candidatus Woesearchaeota archaeon]|nr:cysteine hydrolase [Candidatus Woesearchaeota archaeon]